MADGKRDAQGTTTPSAGPDDGAGEGEVLARFDLSDDGEIVARDSPEDEVVARVEAIDEDGEVVIGEVRHPPAGERGPQEEPPLTNADFGGSDEEPTDGDGEDGELAVVNYEDRLVEALPDLARLAAVAGTRTMAWGLRMGLRATARLARASVDPQAAADLAQDVGVNVRTYARDVLGITDLEERVRLLTPVGDRFAGPGAGTRALAQKQESAEVPPELRLRAQGAELLRQSADVNSDDHLHPAFGRILSELAPDEGRILRLVAHEGPQPVVDVRTASLIGKGSQLVAQNLNMVAMAAGCRHPDHVAAYLSNLQRLGIVCFSDTPLEDEMAYQVLEAQPHVLDAIKCASRAKSVQRTLRLTAFGEAFCEVCFPREFTEVQELTGDPGELIERARRPPELPSEHELQTGQPTPSENSQLGS